MGRPQGNCLCTSAGVRAGRGISNSVAILHVGQNYVAVLHVRPIFVYLSSGSGRAGHFQFCSNPSRGAKICSSSSRGLCCTPAFRKKSGRSIPCEIVLLESSGGRKSCRRVGGYMGRPQRNCLCTSVGVRAGRGISNNAAILHVGQNSVSCRKPYGE